MLIYTYVSTLSTAFGKSKPAWVYFASKINDRWKAKLNIYKCRRSWSEMSGRSPEAGAGLDFGAGLITMIIIHYMSVRADLWCKATRSNTSKVTCMVVHVISVSTFMILHNRMLQQLRNHPTSPLAPLWVNNNRRFLSQCISTLWFPSHGSQQQSQRPRSTMNSDQISTAAQIGEEGRVSGEEQKESLRSFTNKGFTPDTPF